MKGLHMISWILLIVGGLNWLVLGIFKWDIGMLFGADGNPISRIIYILVGIAALIELFTHKKNCSCCEKKSEDMPAGTI